MMMAGEQMSADRDELVNKIDQEMNALDPEAFPEIRRILDSELFDLRGGVTKWVDLIGLKKTKVRARVNIPTDQFPNLNFVGKLLGAGGANLKAMQEQTMTKMAILGQGSTRNPEKELELLNSGDPKYSHLKGRLHVQIDCSGDPAETYYRVSHALAEVKKSMTPDESMEMPWGGMMMQGGGGGMRGGGRGARGFRGGGRGRDSGYGMASNGGGDAGGFRNYDQSNQWPQAGGKMMRGGGFRGGRGGPRGGAAAAIHPYSHA